MPNQIRLVCFDWGGVILRHCRSWEEGCAEAGLDVRGEVMQPEFITRRRALTAEYQRGAISTEEFFHGLAEANRGLYSVEELMHLHHCWLQGEYEGIGEVLRRLAGTTGVETALLSNTNHSHWVRHLPKADGSPADFPAAGYLKHRHASHLLGLAKPDPAIYRAFEERVGFSGPQVLFFDDLPDNLAAARTLGWKGVLIDHNKDTAAQVSAALREHGIW